MLEINNLTKRNISSHNLGLIASDFLSNKKISKAEVSLVLISDTKFKELNDKYRSQDKVSDVLSFSNPDFNYGSDNFLGEIFINLQDIARVLKYEEMLGELGLNACDFKDKESLKEFLLNFIFIHGLLHLTGLNDELEVERKEMIKVGYDFLKKSYRKNNIKFN